jgi:1-acyl-sn-glycerol-3-phosphate acyltransferase
VLLIAARNDEKSTLAGRLINELRAGTGEDFGFITANDFCNRTSRSGNNHFLYLPSFTESAGMTPDTIEAEQVYRRLARIEGAKVVVVSSALVYGIGPGRQPLVDEEYSAPRKGNDTVCAAWNKFEGLAIQHLTPQARLTILRPVTVVPSESLLSNMLRKRFIPTLPGHDATLQLLSPDDLARAIRCAFASDKAGIFNVAPDQAVSTHAAIRLAGSRRIPLPRTLLRLQKNPEILDYGRYPWTVSNRKIKKELGFTPAKTSLTALLEARGGRAAANPEPVFDEFGMDKKYIDFYGTNLFKFLAEIYWRIETRGLEHVPQNGRAVLVGMHRGFMPWDGVMALHLIARKLGRYPRFLVHPGLLKFPFLSNFMTKLGGVVACRDSAARILESEELLGVFPEGIEGAFTPYRDAYKLQGFGRNAFVKMALHHRAPIVPFVTVGSAEIFPILGKINSKRWSRYADWPCIPLTPTFPIVPLPLPSKWHTVFLPPIHVEDVYPPEAARDRSIVKAISADVQAQMQKAIDEMLARRRSIFWGSLFPAGREQ